jgi:hypothetical protein
MTSRDVASTAVNLDERTPGERHVSSCPIGT